MSLWVWTACDAAARHPEICGGVRGSVTYFDPSLVIDRVVGCHSVLGEC